MSKKIWYSSPLKLQWDKLYGTQKKITPELSDEQIFSVLYANMLNSPFAPGENTQKRDLNLSGLQLWKEDLNGDLLHIFFLDRLLRDFLVKTPLSDLDGIRKYMYENGKNKEIVYFETKGHLNTVMYSFGLHIPFETNGYGFSITLDENDSMELFFSHGDKSGRMSDNFYKELNKKNDQSSVTYCNMYRLAVNTIAYMNCFPDCVSEGVPPISYSKNEDRSNKNIIFQMTDQIMDSENSPRSKIPHFRKGHFRVLTSDFYTNKKGQIIYVAETMVKGKAKTISTSNDLEDFNKKASK